MAQCLQAFSDELTSLPLAASPLNPPILGDFNSISPQIWGARGAKLAVNLKQQLHEHTIEFLKISVIQISADVWDTGG
ncbi:hypothetical protein BJP34_35025 [Moorena producens PAL-8-15-08-1]|uniref:Uncharacterized protein n=1 Tax=Moorena producens PAL-8-15-08-1 TaxID=1458985 RepID=A0A1D8U215_9CYAN|nr:hypothetical protein BJP34_35025 [Moorena producens PAL-8-15-08-1]